MSGRLFLPTLFRELGQTIDNEEIRSIETIRAGLFSKKIPEIQIQHCAKE